MYALVDCNNFYASCEQVFKPSLRNKPVVVLSNNDGCIIARSKEAKALGIKMAQPAFEMREFLAKHRVAVFSSNYTLYGDMSSRVMSLLSSFTPDIEIYSIDEAFLNLTGFANLQEYGQRIVKEVTKGTGIPVSMGIAPTKTLAKIANHYAKNYPQYKSVCLNDDDSKRIPALQFTDVGDVWGIGRQLKKRLNQIGVNTAYDFTQLRQTWVKKNLTIVGERIWKELHGESCIELESTPSPKKQICTSRSFGSMITDLDQLSAAIATYASLCAEKLREQDSCAVSLMVFIHTNHFREDLPQYAKNQVFTLPTPTSNTVELVQYSLRVLEQIYAPGFKYKKAGVIITETTPASAIQKNLFDRVDRNKQALLSEVMDRLNSGFTQRQIGLAIQQIGQQWHLRQEHCSPAYTTDLDNFFEVRC